MKKEKITMRKNISKNSTAYEIRLAEQKRKRIGVGSRITSGRKYQLDTLCSLTGQTPSELIDMLIREEYERRIGR